MVSKCRMYHNDMDSQRICPINFILTSLFLSLPLNLSLTLWCLWGSERIWVEYFSGRWTKSVHNKKLFLNRKTQDSTVNIHMAGMFFMKPVFASLQILQYYLMFQILTFTPCGFYNAYLNNIAVLSQWGISKHGVMVSLFM